VQIPCNLVAVIEEPFLKYPLGIREGKRMVLTLKPEDLPAMFVQEPRGLGERYIYLCMEYALRNL